MKFILNKYGVDTFSPNNFGYADFTVHGAPVEEILAHLKSQAEIPVSDYISIVPIDLSVWIHFSRGYDLTTPLLQDPVDVRVVGVIKHQGGNT